MAVSAADVVWYKASAGASDGGSKSATPVTSTKGDFWPNVSDAERTAGGTRIKKSFLTNEHATDSLLAPVVWISVVPTNMTEEIGLGFDDADDDANTQGNMTALGANALIALVSSGADTRTATIIGLDASGNPQQETVTLNGTTEVVSVGTYSAVYAIHLSAESATLTVTAKQGAGGTTIGTIGPNVEACWLWIAATSKASGLKLADLIAGASYGFWHRQTWAAGVPAVRPDESRISVEES